MEFWKKRKSLVSSSSGNFTRTVGPTSDEILEEVIRDCQPGGSGSRIKFSNRSKKLVQLAQTGIHERKASVPLTSKPSSVLSLKRNKKERAKDSGLKLPAKDKMGQVYSRSDLKPIRCSDNVEQVPDSEPDVVEDCTNEPNEPNEIVESPASTNDRIQRVIDGVEPGSHTMFECRNIRIGTLRTAPSDRLVLSTAGLRFTVPSITSDAELVVLTIRLEEILRVLVYVHRCMPVIFLYCTITTGKRIAAELKMDPSSGPFYSPQGPDPQRRITILPARLSDESKTAIFKIFGDKVREVTNNEANVILIRCSGSEATKLSSAAKDTATTSNAESPQEKLPVRTIMTYPPPPASGGISINTEDYSCLGGMMFLNDIIIDFYLIYLTLQVLTEVDRNRTHVFSTFFYKRLTTRPKKNRRGPDEDSSLTAAEKRHARVKSWTKKVNIFEKDFIVIPINESSHWFLAVICFPGLPSPVSMTTGRPVSAASSAASLATPTRLTEPRAKRDTIVTLDEVGSDRDEAEGEEDEELGTSDDEESNVTNDESADPSFGLSSASLKVKEVKNAKVNFRVSEPIKQPCILIFDSLGGASRARVVATLRDYLTIEHRTKMGAERVFTKDVIKGATPKVPQQNNFYDCGLFLLQYAESFFQSPITDYKLPIRQLQSWFEPSLVAGKREEIARLLMRLMEENGVDVAALNLPELQFTTPDWDEGDDEMMDTDDPEGKYLTRYSTVTTLHMPKEETEEEETGEESSDAGSSQPKRVKTE